jgi:MoaA/NifB/PqqE/SkfB family radical SAM enzyme
VKSQQGYKNPTPRQFANDLMAVKSFERGGGGVHHKPIEVYLQVASACNLDCYMCYEHLRPPRYRRGRGLRSMPPELFAKIEREILPYSTKITFGVGGEPMLCEHLLDYIQRAYAARQHVHMMTNGTRITSDEVAETLARCLTSLEISIDAATKETYERIRLGSRWEHIFANIERLNRFRFQGPPEERTHLSLCFVMMKSNVHELPRFIDVARQLRADRVAAWHVIPVTEEGRREALIDDQERSDHYLALAHARAVELGLEADLVKPFRKGAAELAPTLAGSRQSVIERMADLDHAAKMHSPSAGAAGNGGPAAAESSAPESAGAAPVPEPTPAEPSSPAALPSGAATETAPPPGAAAHDEVNGQPAEAHDAHAVHEPEALELDANGMLAPVSFSPIADPPDPLEAARALVEFNARPKGERLHCASPYTTVFIFYDGRVFPCCHPHAHVKLPMGNLLRQDFGEVWNGRAYRNLRAGLKLGDPPPICQRCSIVHGPSEQMETAGPLEGEGADLASYYGALDLDPQPKTVGSAGLVGALESAGVADRLQANAHEREAFEVEGNAMVGHIKNVEGEPVPLREHAHAAEDNLLKLHRYADDLEHERDALAGHARSLQAELLPLREHAKTLEIERDGLAGHAANREAEREHLLGHVRNLERILRESHGMLIYRLRRKATDALFFWRKREG